MCRSVKGYYTLHDQALNDKYTVYPGSSPGLGAGKCSFMNDHILNVLVFMCCSLSVAVIVVL